MLDKWRWLQKLSLSDRLFHEILASELTERVEAFLSDSICSYRKGRGRQDVLSGIQKFLKDYRKSNPVLKERKLFALRLDISSYTDSIPVGDASPLWRLFEARSQVFNSVWLENLKGALRSTIQAHDQFGDYCQWIGIPTGSPLTPIIANVYLHSLDQWLEEKQASFYRRYGDDIVFITSSESIFNEVLALIPAKLKSLGLETKQEKVRKFCWSGSGAAFGFWPGRASLDLLGVRIQWNGTLTIPDRKTAAMLRDLNSRMKSSLRLVKSAEKEVQIRALCRTAELFFDEESSFAHPLLNDIRMFVRSDAYYHSLDFHTAKMISSLITSNHTLLTFRELSWKSLIQKYDWKSPHFLMLQSRTRCRSA